MIDNKIEHKQRIGKLLLDDYSKAPNYVSMSWNYTWLKQQKDRTKASGSARIMFMNCR